MKSLVECMECGRQYPLREVRYTCDCKGLLEVVHDWNDVQLSKALFDGRLSAKKGVYHSGVWRFKELILDIEERFIVSSPEGNTNMYGSDKISEYAGLRNLYLKHDGENPTGSFKDRGMTVGISIAKMLGMKNVACASTGNTSASLASYAARAGMRCLVFVPEGKIAHGKLAQALAYGAKTFQIEGDFDRALRFVREVCSRLNIYLLNSINPFRIEGQKSVVFEILQWLDWEIPDWIVLPGGNLGNSAAVFKGLRELHQLGLIDEIPRVAVIQAHGANPLYRMWKQNKDFEPIKNPRTIATAISIGNPVSWKKSLEGMKHANGVVEELTEEEILDAKAVVDSSGVGCEPASACSVGGIKKLVESGIIDAKETVVGILTGNLLKDPDVVVDYHMGFLEGITPKSSNRPKKIRTEIEEIGKFIED